MSPITLKSCLTLISLVLVVSGCANRAKITHRSVSDLYSEAVEKARSSKISIANEVENVSSTSLLYPVTQNSQESSKADATATSLASASQTQTKEKEASPPKIAGKAKWKPIIPAALSEISAATRIRQEELPVVSANWNFSQTPVVSAASPELLQSALPVRGEPLPIKPLINEIFEQTDIREAIDILASANGETVVVDDTVGGVVSVQIKNATFEEALNMLLLPLGLVYAVRDGAYLVAPPDPQSPLFSLISERFQYAPTNHAPTRLTDLLPKRLTPFYQASDERNLIVIDAPRAIATDLVDRLRELDIPVQQVVLEAIICVTSPNSGFLFGMDWNHSLTVSSADQFRVGMKGLAFSGAGSRFGTNNAFADFAVTSAFVQLLAQQGYVTIRAAPRITAKDGEKASIEIGRETFFSLQPTSANVLFRQDVQQVDAGINLIITPRIRGDMVSVEIEKAEVSEDIRNSDTDSAINSNPYPVINRRQVSTKVDVMDGQTIVIGGLVQRQTVDNINKIPFLGSLPGIGAFFRTVSKQEQETEVAIFISPRIVRDVCLPDPLQIIETPEVEED